MKYRVQIREIHYVSIDVEADNEEEAKVKASDYLWDNNDLEVEYSHTTEPEEWPVTIVRD